MTQRIERILVAVDGSARASGVLAVACDMAGSLGATMHVLRVISIPPEFPPIANNGRRRDPLPSILEREALQAMRALVAAEPRAAGARLIVCEGPQAWRTILEVARDAEVDLIVIGSHGYGGLDRVLGTTAGKVANMAECNVLVVHDAKARATAAEPVSRRSGAPSSRRTRSSRRPKA